MLGLKSAAEAGKKKPNSITILAIDNDTKETLACEIISKKDLTSTAGITLPGITILTEAPAPAPKEPSKVITSLKSGAFGIGNILEKTGKAIVIKMQHGAAKAVELKDDIATSIDKSAEEFNTRRDLKTLEKARAVEEKNK